MFELYRLSEVTPYAYHFSGILFTLIWVIFWKNNSAPYVFSFKKDWKYYLLFASFLLFVLTSAYGLDFYGYMENVERYSHDITGFHLEKIYEYIIEYTNQNYFLFRLVVWGGAMMLFTQTVDKYELDSTRSLFLLFLLFIPVFTYARATLAMACYYCGIAYFSLKNNKIEKAIGIFLILASFLFHKSLFVLILFTLFYYLPLNRRNVLLLIGIVLLFGYGIDQLMNSFMGALMGLGDEQLAEKLERNLEDAEMRTDTNMTIYGMISTIWHYTPFYLTFYIISNELLKKKNEEKIPQYIKGLYRIVFSVILLATAMLLFSEQTLTYFYRYLYMTMIPLIILLVYLYQNRLLSVKSYKWILYIGGGYNIFTFLTFILR